MLTTGIFLGQGEAGIADWRDARERGVISPAEADELKAMDDAVAKVIAVDDFAADEIASAPAAAATKAHAAR